jgi:hypothetical protein
VSIYWPWSATHWVKKRLETDEKQATAQVQVTMEPKIVAFGYSLGVPHELRFARALKREGIPIELLVAVDSKGFTDGMIPANVKTAANYYERRLYPLLYPLYYGKGNLFPEDDRRTNFLGNFLVHAGHFGIVTVGPMRELMVDTVRELLARENKCGTGFPDSGGPAEQVTSCGRKEGHQFSSHSSPLLD